MFENVGICFQNVVVFALLVCNLGKCHFEVCLNRKRCGKQFFGGWF